MKFFILINSLAGGGAEKVAINLFNFLQIDKIFLLEKEIKYQISEEKITLLSNYTSKTSSILKTIFIPMYVLKLKQKISKDSIVISFLERANYVNIITSFFTGHKTIISVHMSQLCGRNRFHPYNLLTKILYSKADLIVCVSKGIADELYRYYGISKEKLKVIYNGIDFKYINEKSKESLNSYDQIFQFPVIIATGRLTKQKGYWYILRIFKILKNKFPDLKLVIIGEGELKNYLVNLSQKLDLKTFVWNRDIINEKYDVYFLGFQKNPFKFIAKAKLFILSSLYEGFPNILLEAMACGVPIISTDCKTGPREILAPDTDFNYQTEKPEYTPLGILMPVFEGKYKKASEPLGRTEEMWIEIIRNLFKNEELREKLGQGVQKRSEDFKIGKIIEDWKNILKSL